MTDNRGCVEKGVCELVGLRARQHTHNQPVNDNRESQRLSQSSPLPPHTN